MPMSRCLKNDMRSAKGPVAGTSTPKGSGSSSKQYKQTGPKYSGPNYPQADPSTAKYGKTGLK